MSEITLLLQSAATDVLSRDRLYALLYAELKRLARSHLARMGPRDLDPAAIVHEAWIRCRDAVMPTQRRAFFAYAGAAMRSVIVDHVREQAADKRGGGDALLTLSTAAFEALPSPTGRDGPHGRDARAVAEAMDMLARVDARCHRVIELRYFAGLTLEEVAQELALSVPTVKRDWQRARAFLLAQLSP
jgi:RNA polymerase sigma factor (TIGR02999 family)